MNTLQKKILIVEDNNVIRSEIADIMRMEDFSPIEAKNGEEGLEQARKELPDLIISDILMPKIDGIGLLKKLKENKLTEEIPFIFISALTDSEYVRKGMYIGADDYLTKPIQIDELIKIIKLKLAKEEKIKKRLDELRRNIILSIPHELRTPLNGILGFSHILMTSSDSSNKTKEFAKYINVNGNRLLNFINQYLKITNLMLLQSDKEKCEELNKQITVNIKDLTSNILIRTKEEYNYKRKINLDIPNISLKIKQDHLEIILKELISNAIKFKRGDKEINIYCQKEKAELKIIIENYGNGINAEQINNIGTFMQFDRDKQEQQGLGIGLSIVKLIVEIYKLELKIESEKDKYFRACIKFNIAV